MKTALFLILLFTIVTINSYGQGNTYSFKKTYYGLQLSSKNKIEEWKNNYSFNMPKSISRWELNLAGGSVLGRVAVNADNTTIKNYQSDHAIWSYFSNLSGTRIFHSGIAFKLNFQYNRIEYEHIYANDLPLSKTRTKYDLLNMNLNGGYNYDFGRISLHSYVGIGAQYILKKVVFYSSNFISNWTDNYNFYSNFGGKDLRWAIPVSFSFGIDFKMSRLLSISLNSGFDYNLTSYTLRREGYAEYYYIAHSINLYSYYICTGIILKIQKDEKL